MRLDPLSHSDRICFFFFLKKIVIITTIYYVHTMLVSKERYYVRWFLSTLRSRWGNYISIFRPFTLIVNLYNLSFRFFLLNCSFLIEVFISENSCRHWLLWENLNQTLHSFLGPILFLQFYYGCKETPLFTKSVLEEVKLELWHILTSFYLIVSVEC